MKVVFTRRLILKFMLQHGEAMLRGTIYRSTHIFALCRRRRQRRCYCCYIKGMPHVWYTLHLRLSSYERREVNNNDFGINSYAMVSLARSLSMATWMNEELLKPVEWRDTNSPRVGSTRAFISCCKINLFGNLIRLESLNAQSLSDGGTTKYFVINYEIK